VDDASGFDADDGCTHRVEVSLKRHDARRGSKNLPAILLIYFICAALVSIFAADRASPRNRHTPAFGRCRPSRRRRHCVLDDPGGAPRQHFRTKLDAAMSTPQGTVNDYLPPHWMRRGLRRGGYPAAYRGKKVQ